MKNKIKNCFYAGLVATLPLILTLYFVSWAVTFVTGLIKDSFLIKILIESVFQMESVTTRSEAEAYVRMGIYIIVLLVILLLIVLAGAALQFVVVRKAAEVIDKICRRIPLVNSVYTTINQITSLFSADKASSYKKVVLLEYPRRGIYSIGFLTSESNGYFRGERDDLELVNVFIPTSPNPTSGMFVSVDKKEIRTLDMKVEEAVKLIISGGAIVPENTGSQKNEKSK